MTDSQIKYQALMEDQRHNMALESLSKEENRAKMMQAEASQRQAATSEADLVNRQVQATASLMQAQASQRQAEAALSQAKSKRTSTGLGIAQFVTSMLLPDANTVLRTGGQIVSSLFG